MTDKQIISNGYNSLARDCSSELDTPLTSQIIIDGVDVSGCVCFATAQAIATNTGYILKDVDNACTPRQQPCTDIKDCMFKKLSKQLKRKEQEYEELRQYHNKCCEENAKKETEWLEKYNQVSQDFYSGKYCNKENCSLLQSKEQECERLKEDEKSLLNVIDDLQKTKNEWEEKYNDLGQDLDQLKAENEELKSKVKLYEEILQRNTQGFKTGYEASMFSDMVNGVVNSIRDKKLFKLSKTLTEIKEIAERAKKDICNNCGWRNTDSCDPEDYTCGEFIKILQKISEVENDIK